MISVLIGPFPSGFPTKILYPFLISLIRDTCPAPLMLLNLFSLIVSRVSSGSIVSDYGPGDRVSIPGGGKGFFL
jgi:hypothetical protein